MKRTAFSLCAILIALSTSAQGIIRQRLQGHPKIDSLVNEVKALGGGGRVTYNYDGRLHKNITIVCTQMNDFKPTPPTSDPKRDSMMRKNDSIRLMRIEQEKKIYDAIRRTCKSLTDEAKESYSWEYHRNGVDSVRYTIALGEYASGDTMTTYQRDREVFYYHAPEIITFHYDPRPDNDGSPWRLKGSGYFTYEYTPDSVGRKLNELAPFDKEAFAKLLQPILNQKGISKRQFYVYHDSTYTFEQKNWDNKEYVVRQNTLSPRQLKSETWGSVYTLRSSELADSVLNQFVQATWTFLDAHPGVRFSFMPGRDYGLKTLEELFTTSDWKRVPSSYKVFIHRNHIPGSQTEQEYHIVILESKGDMMVPSEWLILKSWKNGKAVYDRKAAKAMTPKEARDISSGFRYDETRQFEPVD